MINEAERLTLLIWQFRSAFPNRSFFSNPFTYTLVFERMLPGRVYTLDLRANTSSTTRNRSRQFRFFPYFCLIDDLAIATD